MSAGYQAVLWNRQKRRYDAVLLAGVVVFLLVFVGVGGVVDPQATPETLVIRGLGACAFALLHAVLLIGPLCRLDPRWLPLLYNRRHLGVATFTLGLGHGLFALVQFHSLGDLNPLVSLLSAESSWSEVAGFPFQILGLAALVVLFLMAATSHDFWLAHLGAPVWKALHMTVYVAYALLVAHVALGAVQSQQNLLLPAFVLAGAFLVVGVHVAASRRESSADAKAPSLGEGWVDGGPFAEIEDGRAKVVNVGGERVAVFRHGDRLSAVSNVCQHQNGPLGEGRILDGCITCPWHGYQYDPCTGASPPPFSEKVPVFVVRVVRGRVEIDPRPRPPGTRIEPVAIAGAPR